MTDLPNPWRPALLRAEVDAALADWAWHLDHGDYDALVEVFTGDALFIYDAPVEVFTEDALFITATVELRGRSAIKHRHSERVVVRSTGHTYSGLRVGPVSGDSGPPRAIPARRGRPPDPDPGRSTRVNFAANAPAPVDDVGVYLVAYFDDVLTRCDDSR